MQSASALGRKLDDVGNVIRENRNLTSTAVDNTNVLIAKLDNLRREILHDALTATQRECGNPRRRTRKSKWAECSFHFATHLWDIYCAPSRPIAAGLVVFGMEPGTPRSSAAVNQNEKWKMQNGK